MATLNRIKFFCFFFLCLTVIVPKLHADEAPVALAPDHDDYWKERAKQAATYAHLAFTAKPEEVTKNFNHRVSRFINGTKVTNDVNDRRRNLKGKDPERQRFDKRRPIKGNRDLGKWMNKGGAGKNKKVRNRIPNNPGHRTKNVNTRKKKYVGECWATNPIDECWRCDKNWAENRKKLADCGLGFGRKATGGKNGSFYVVSDHNDDPLNPQPGTLRHAAMQKQPLWIIFSRSMNIFLKQELLVNCDKTIDGRGANVHISGGAGLTIQYANNVIIHNLHIHDIKECTGGKIRDSVDHFGERTKSDGDGISIFGSSNIWIDHISMSNCKDGLIDAIMGSTAITISNCHFTHHDEVMLFGASDSHTADEKMQITVAFNHFGQGLQQRMPRCRYGFFHIVNNDYTHWLLYAIGGSKHPTIISQGNRFIASNNSTIKEVTQRNNHLSESEWKDWTWRSEGDLMVNGAFFVQSGDANYAKRFSSDAMITAKPVTMIGVLTKFTGFLNCKRGFPC